MSLREMQNEVREWSNRNFPSNTYVEPFMGLVEEVGELSHSLLKQRQGIRGSTQEHELGARDAVGDIMIYLMDLCSRRDWDLQGITEETWNKVKQRDWQKNKQDGGEE